LAVWQIADLMAAAWGEPAKWNRLPDPEGPFESSLLSLDSKKAFDLLGWRNRWFSSYAVIQAAIWYRQCARPDFNALEASNRQLRQYLARWDN
jgi:nucleoside-diphosphate-sugar epimerase